MTNKIIIFLLLTIHLQGQDSKSDTTSTLDPNKWGNKSTHRPFFEPTYTIYNLHNNINSKNILFFKDIGNYSSVGFNGNAKGSGDVGFFGLIWVKEVTLAFNYFLPITKNYSDTLLFKFSGFNFSINYGKDLFYSNKTIDILPTYGYGFSNVKLEQTKTTEYKKYINSAFIFNFLLEVRLNFINYKKYKLLSLGAKGGYQVDCSNPNWRINHKITADISKYRQTGTFVQGFISLNL